VEKSDMVANQFFAAFAGVFESRFGENALQQVVFYGEVVVNCVVNVDKNCSFSAAKNGTPFSTIF
jgi:hypothetical protein